jgi:hypothetical protein
MEAPPVPGNGGGGPDNSDGVVHRSFGSLRQLKLNTGWTAIRGTKEVLLGTRDQDKGRDCPSSQRFLDQHVLFNSYE